MLFGIYVFDCLGFWFEVGVYFCGLIIVITWFWCCVLYVVGLVENVFVSG